MTVRVSNIEIQRAANQLARLLDEIDGERRGGVAILLPNCPEFLSCLRAATWSGRALTPINWHLHPDEIAYILSNSEARFLVAHCDFSDVVEPVASTVEADCRFAVGGDITGFRPFSNISCFDDGELSNPRAGNLMLYTSGTTGRPKGVKPPSPEGPPPPLSSLMGMGMLSMYLGEQQSGPHLAVAPLYHAAGLTYAEGAALLGSDVVIMERWDAEGFLQTVEREGIVSTFLVPTHFVRLLALPEEIRQRYDTSSLRLLTHGAAPVSIAVKRRMIEWLGPVLFEFYGGTEGGGTSISSTDWLQHPGSVGRPRPGLSVHILDDTGQECPPGTVGDVYFYSADGGFEYKDDPAKTASAYRGQRYTLGDIGYLDEEGFLYLCDRRADVIISGGVNVYPAQIEAVLQEHSAVVDCCVVGIPDDEWGESVLAVVAGDADKPLDANTLTEYCREHLASHQLPRRIVFVDRLPRTDTGKLLRREIRDHYRKQE